MLPFLVNYEILKQLMSKIECNQTGNIPSKLGCFGTPTSNFIKKH